MVGSGANGARSQVLVVADPVPRHGVTLMLGPAGSGKTDRCLERASRALQEGLRVAYFHNGGVPGLVESMASRGLDATPYLYSGALSVFPLDVYRLGRRREPGRFFRALLRHLRWLLNQVGLAVVDSVTSRDLDSAPEGLGQLLRETEPLARAGLSLVVAVEWAVGQPPLKDLGVPVTVVALDGRGREDRASLPGDGEPCETRY